MRTRNTVVIAQTVYLMSTLGGQHVLLYCKTNYLHILILSYLI